MQWKIVDLNGGGGVNTILYARTSTQVDKQYYITNSESLSRECLLESFSNRTQDTPCLGVESSLALCVVCYLSSCEKVY